MHYERALDLIFASYLKAKPLIAGKLDREVRDPSFLLSIARKHDLLPAPDKVLKVTGSKGKGTVARLCAHNLMAHRGKVALLVSPEEITHLDRMSINGQIITEAEFLSCFEEIWGYIEQPQSPHYLSPYGLFLLIALCWFKRQDVDCMVIETGRGVRFDEGGQLPAKVGVVTSVFLEHPTYLGPHVEDIRADKMSLGETCDFLINGCEISPVSTQYPAWYGKACAIAQRALQAFCGQEITVQEIPVASFGQKENEAGQVMIYEGMIAKESADVEFLKALLAQYKGEVVFYISLPDDKDVAGVCDLLQNLGASFKHIIMTGERGFLSYEKARVQSVAYEGAYDDVVGLQQGLNLGTAKVIYFIGTQTFLRLVKQAFFS
ncbi:MAG: hypothetical protein HWE34_14670 [Methylocystaceae bacterium]|nr:hypothetical protein [Methylocystaceae bacterium]